MAGRTTFLPHSPVRGPRSARPPTHASHPGRTGREGENPVFSQPEWRSWGACHPPGTAVAFGVLPDAMSLLGATTVSGIDSLAVLRRNLAIARGFKPRIAAAAPRRPATATS